MEEERQLQMATEALHLNDSSTSSSPAFTTTSWTSSGSVSPILSTKSIQTPPGTGYVHNLTLFQRRLLFQLWGMLLDYLSRPAGETDQQQQAAAKLYYLKKTPQTPRSYAESVFSSSLGSLGMNNNSSTTSLQSTASAISIHPVADELWIQAGTGDLDGLLLRFLRARKWILIDAFVMAVDTLKWRRSFGVRHLLVEGEEAVKRDLFSSGKSFFWNVDRQGRPVVILTGRLHDKNAQSLEDTLKHTVLNMEIGRRLFGDGVETVLVIFDLQSAGLASLDMASMQFMIQCFQSYYPESLGRILILNAPWIFWGFWRVLKTFLDPVVAGKIQFVDEQRAAEQLAEHIEPSRLLRQFPGGQSTYQYRYIPPGPEDRPVPLPEAEEAALNLRLESIKSEFIDLTLQINKHYLTSQEETEPLKPLMDKRNQLKTQLTEIYKYIDDHTLPKTLYHRMGVIKSDGTVNWKE